MEVSPVAVSSLSVQSLDRKAIIDQELQLAMTAKDRPEKRVHYEKVFKEFCFLSQNGVIPTDLTAKFFQFLQLFADQTCRAEMGQTGPDEGFRKAACLMQLSFLLQMKEKVNVEWFKEESLESLINTIGLSQSSLFEPVKRFIEGAELGVIRERGTPEMVRTTLRDMAYAYQNIEVVNRGDLPLHKKMNDFIEGLFDQTNQQGQLDLAEFVYNRCGFLIGLEPLAEDLRLVKQIEAYDNILAVFEKHKPTQPDPAIERLIQAKKSQVNNMKGILTIKQKNIPGAEAYFREAFKLREQLLQSSTDPQDEYFLSNIRTGIIHCLCQPPIEKSRLLEANEHAQALGVYVEKLQASQDKHLYQTSYATAVLKVATVFHDFVKNSISS